MKPAPFAYARPHTLGAALEALAGDPQAKVLAGGQSLVPLLSMRLAAPSAIVDLGALPDLDHVRCDDTGVHVGALARQSGVLADDEVRRTQPLLPMALSHVAHAAIRNRGTVVGSLVHADPAAELPAVMVLLGGRLTAASGAGRRTIPAAELYAGPMESTLRPGEIAVEAFFPALGEGEGVAFDEIARRRGDYAMCGVAAWVRVTGGKVTAARAAYLSVAEVPTAVDLTEAMAGASDPELADDVVDAVAEEVGRRLEPAADLHASAAYRAHLVRVLTGRVVAAAYRHALDREEAR